MSGHKWASRSSVITHLNRRRSSQSLDVQEPHDGARDDGTVCGIVRLAPTPHGSILVTWTMYLDTQVDIALKCHNSAQSWPFESKLGFSRASGRCPRRWYHPPAQTHKAGRRRARYMRRTSHRTHPDTSVNRPYLTLTEADSDALWSSVTTGPRRFVSSTAWTIHTLLSCSKSSI